MTCARAIGIAVLVGSAGLAVAQPVIDGVYNDATENEFFGPIRWVNSVPTGFGDNIAGQFFGGDFGDPENVTTGVEICIAKSALGSPSSFRLGGWVTSGDRTFMSNQTIGSMPIDTSNIGGGPDFSDAGAFPGHQFISVASIPNATIVVDGTADAGYGAAVYTQTNYTGFGDSTDGTDIGGGGSEVDQVFVAQDATNIYIMIAGNLEANGNGLDLHIDVNGVAGGAAAMGNGSGNGAFIVDGPSVTFDTGIDDADKFRPDYIISVDAFNHDDDDGTTPNVPRAWYGVYSGDNATVDMLGHLAGYGAANGGALANGDAGVPAASLAVDNSNIAGVIGNPSLATPVSPDANWGYGCEMDNLRAGIVQNEVGFDYLYIFIGGNMETNFNKLNLFFDCQPGGQNQVGFDGAGDPIDNVDISFGALQNMAGVKFETGFGADFWLNINNGQDGGSGNLINYSDCAVLRSDGRLVDEFTLTPLDYGAYYGGDVTDGVGVPVPSPVELMDFSGPRVDIQDGFTNNLFCNYGPRQTQIDPENPVAALIQTAIDNSNVAGITDTAAIESLARQVSTGIEICIDLDE
ncbi:MAG: hypothetical protein K8E66_04400, partial [Phycisphaerales bacterium]|nr:hypothetical protein [Phycisphaerales bacterium]